jgi:hypothetical protein
MELGRKNRVVRHLARRRKHDDVHTIERIGACGRGRLCTLELACVLHRIVFRRGLEDRKREARVAAAVKICQRVIRLCAMRLERDRLLQRGDGLLPEWIELVFSDGGFGAERAVHLAQP